MILGLSLCRLFYRPIGSRASLLSKVYLPEPELTCHRVDFNPQKRKGGRWALGFKVGYWDTQGCGNAQESVQIVPTLSRSGGSDDNKIVEVMQDVAGPLLLQCPMKHVCYGIKNLWG